MSDTQFTDIELCDELTALLHKLSEKDQSFASSLLQNVRQYGSATSKQRPWLEKLIARANGQDKPPERTKTEIGSLAGVMALFDKARAKLKAPAIVIRIGDRDIRISVASATARVPGSLNVATDEGYGSSTWFGRILEGGVFEASPRDPTPPELIAGLQRFATEPAKMAAEHGHLTGKCCFCSLPLTDERSAAVGYGKKCSQNFGLPYPKASDVKRAKGSDLFAEAV